MKPEMKPDWKTIYVHLAAALAVGLGALTHAAVRADAPLPPPAVGERAPEFTLRDLAGEEFGLKESTGPGPVVLLVLRGYPGYQCPICTRQVGEFLGRAREFGAKGARVVMIYPGPAEGLDEHAREFLGGKSFPDRFTFLIDPDYAFTKAYHLRWDAPGETAYPSAFVVDGGGVVRFAKVSRTHAGRASAAEVLKAIDAFQAGNSR